MIADTYLKIAMVCAAVCVCSMLILLILGIKLHILEVIKSCKILRQGGNARMGRENTGIRIIKDIVLVHDTCEVDEEGTWELKGESAEGTMDLRLGV